MASLIKFDLSSLPSDAVITNAYLSLFITQPGNDLPTLTVDRATAAWNQSINGAGKQPTTGDLPLDGDPTWTYSAQPYTAWSTAGAAGGALMMNMATSTNTADDTSLQHQAITSTTALAYINSWVTSPATNFGIVVRLSSATGTVIFGSHAITTTTLAPTLDLTYTTNSGTPPPPSKSVNYAPPPGRFGIGVPVSTINSNSNSGAIIGGVIGGIMGVFVIITIATIFIRS